MPLAVGTFSESFMKSKTGNAIHSAPLFTFQFLFSFSNYIHTYIGIHLDSNESKEMCALMAGGQAQVLVIQMEINI